MPYRVIQSILHSEFVPRFSNQKGTSHTCRLNTQFRSFSDTKVQYLSSTPTPHRVIWSIRLSELIPRFSQSKRSAASCQLIKRILSLLDTKLQCRFSTLTVMGPEDTLAHLGTFLDKVPPIFNGRSNYASYHEDGLLLVNRTSL